MAGALGAPPTDQNLIAQYTRPAYATMQMVPMPQLPPLPQHHQQQQQQLKQEKEVNMV